MFAKEKLYLTAERDTLVKAGDPKAAFLYCTPGDEIPQSAADKFGLVDGKLKKGVLRSSIETLIGSSVLPAMVEIAEGKSVQLGHVVARAHKASGLSFADWNGLPEEKREKLLAETVDAWKAEAAKPAAPKRTRTRKAKAVKE